MNEGIPTDLGQESLEMLDLVGGVDKRAFCCLEFCKNSFDLDWAITYGELDRRLSPLAKRLERSLLVA